MNQSRAVSFVEAAMNTLIGFLISFAIWPLAAWVTGIEYNTAQHFWVIAIFTIVSVARGYIVRRFFNSGLHVLALRFTKRTWRARGFL